MRTMAIRELSVPAIQDAADHGQIIGITNDRILAAVLYPVSSGLTEQLITENLSRLVHNINRGERELEAMAKSGDAARDGGPTTLDDVVTQPRTPAIDLSRARQVNLRDISGKVLCEAARANQPIALTTNRVVAGVIVPVPEQWVNQLVAQNLSRLLHSIDVGERELADGRDITTLDDVV